MKLVMEEKIKHRLVGVGVILSLGAIFLPAIMKKSSQRLENFTVQVQLPPKPVAPDVAAVDEEHLFKTIKIAKVKINSKTSSVEPAQQLEFREAQENTEGHIAAVEGPIPESVVKPIKLALNHAAQTAVKKEIQLAANKPTAMAQAKSNQPKAIKQIATTKPIINKSVAPVYAVQLASFSKLSNAQSLVKKLQQKGYKANYTQTTNRNGPLYKVYVGHSPVKNNVVKLKTQLASAMQLNGFVVNAGVS